MKLLVRPPQLLRRLYRDSLWRMDKKEPTIYLTFDDGPIPELTEWVLDVLKEYQIKATFFCVGDNIVKNPSIFQRITIRRASGWKSYI
jgi:peptidoglycan/xylan/chitin deacetylase (PgdA/CDA1 family)